MGFFFELSLLRSEAAGEIDGLVAANLAFYEAFESGDLKAMSSIWDHSDSVVCGHPGWHHILGWSHVAAAWYTLFTNGERLHFLIDQVHAHIEGSVGIVSCVEQILDGDLASGAAAFNTFVRRDGKWLMQAHVASPIVR